VQRRRSADGYRYRAWARIGGRRVYGSWTTSAQEAYAESRRMRAPGQTATTLGDAIDTLLRETRELRAEGTVRWYDEHLRVVRAALGEATPLRAITPDRLQEWVRDRLRDVQPSTVNADLRALHRVYAVAIRTGLAETNPVRRVRRPREEAPAIDWIPQADLARLLARVRAEDPKAADLFLLLALTGLRRSEAARLMPEHVRPHQIVVRGKTGTRVLPIADDLRPALARLVATGGPIVAGGVRTLDLAFRRWQARLRDPRWHAHALRHSFATALIRAGVQLADVRYLLGHRSLQMVLRYYHETGLESAAAVRRLRLLEPETEEQVGE